MKVCQPLSVLDVRFPSWDGFEVLRIGQEDVAPLFQDVPNWVPVDPGRLEGQVLDVKGAQPLISGQQVGRHRRKREDLLLERPIGLGHQHPHDHRLFMHIDACTAFVDHLHFVSLAFFGLFLLDKRMSTGCGSTTCFFLVLASCEVATFIGPGRTPVSFLRGQLAPM
jgi:hypothetical protein